MRYIVVGPSIVNDIEFQDGSLKKGVIGGSIYCVAGIKLWCDDCLYISNVGKDYNDFYGKWMDDNQCSYDGLNYILPHTQYTTLKYEGNELHSEVSIYGDKEEELVNQLDKPDINFIASHCHNETKGIYIETDEKDSFWDNLDEIKSRDDIRIMWELPTSATVRKERRDKVFSIMKKAGLYSINVPEAFNLFEKNTEEEVIDAIIKFNVPCYLRAGSKGSYMIENGKSCFSKSLNFSKIIDTTGCGNASTAAALYGYCEGYSLEEICLIGNISAAYNLLQYGPYPMVTKTIRQEAEMLLCKK